MKRAETIVRTLIGKIKNHPHLQSRPALRQFIKFAMVGFGNTIFDFAIYLFLTRFFLFWRTHFLWANFISFTVAVVNSYIWNRRWTFRNKHPHIHIQFAKFFIVSIIGLGINEATLYFLVSHLHLYDLIAKIIAVLITTMWNFTANKFWTFYEKAPVRTL